MTTKLEAINTILSCIGQAPLNTLEGTKSYFTIAAEKLLDSETKRIQMQGWDFNSEEHYELQPNDNNHIEIPENLILVKFPTDYKNRFVVREGKLYDKFKHTYEITRPLRCSVVWYFKFDDLPEVAQQYATISAAYKFVKRELGADKASQYTQEDVMEARVALEQHELEIGEYTMIPDMHNGNIRGWL